MLKDREEFTKFLTAAIDRVKYNRRKMEQINKHLSSNGAPRGYFNEVCNNLELLNEVDSSLLYLITDAVYSVDQSPSIKPADYFTEQEIESAKKYSSEDFVEPEVKLPIIISNAIQIEPEVFVAGEKMLNVVKWMKSKILLYDFETQRSPRFSKKIGGGTLPQIDINQKSVESIAERMLSETYFPDMITIRCYSDEFEPVAYNPKTRELVIKEGVLVSALDGMHRIQGALRASLRNPELSQTIILGIRTYDTETSKKFFGQINLVNPVDPTRLKDLNQEKVSFVAVKHLQQHSDLKGRVSTSSKVTKTAGHLTTTDILASAIEEVYEPKSTFEARETGVFLSNFFNYLLGMFPTEFGNNSESLMRHERMFIAYVAIAKQFQDKNISLDKLKEVIDGLDVNYDNEKIVETVVNKRILSGRQIKNIVDFFDQINIAHILE